MKNDRTEPMCLAVDDLCETLGVPRPTAYELVHRDGFPTIRVGRRILVPRAGLEKWLETQANTGR